MRLQKGKIIPEIILPSIDGTEFSTSSIKGKPYMISFFRFATCPFCNMRVHKLVSKFDEFGEDFTIVAIFDSPIDHLTEHASNHHAPFPILADEKNIYYRAFGIERSVKGMFTGIITRFPTLVQGMFKGYIPTSFKGNILTMPADFLINPDGTIHTAYYGKDDGDHLPFSQVKDFSFQKNQSSVSA